MALTAAHAIVDPLNVPEWFTGHSRKDPCTPLYQRERQPAIRRPSPCLRGEVGDHAVALHGTAQRDTEARDYLVEHQHHSIREQSSRASWRYPGAASVAPELSMTGSMITAATSSCRSESSRGERFFTVPGKDQEILNGGGQLPRAGRSTTVAS